MKTRYLDRNQKYTAGGDADPTKSLAILIAIAGAAVTWNNERIRISRTTYDADSRASVISAVDSALMRSLEFLIVSGIVPESDHHA